jgi:prophage maintenance system killer protein
VFLGLNGIDFDVSPTAATAMILALAAGETDGLARWIEDNISPPSGRPPPQAPSISA